MAPKIIELEPDVVDFANDAVKMSTLAIVGFIVNSYILNRPMPFNSTMQTLLVTITSLGVYHLLVDPMVVRFVVKSGAEGFYMASKRHN